MGNMLSLVDIDGQLELMLEMIQVPGRLSECNCNATAIGGSSNLWLVGGEDGWFGVMIAGDSRLHHAR